MRHLPRGALMAHLRRGAYAAVVHIAAHLCRGETPRGLTVRLRRRCTLHVVTFLSFIRGRYTLVRKTLGFGLALAMSCIISKSRENPLEARAVAQVIAFIEFFH